jgi:uncharacterized membrane protein
VGEHPAAPWPVALYGLVLLCAGGAYFLLERTLISLHGRESALSTAVGRDRKAMMSIASYAAAVPLAFVNTWISCALYAVVAVIWLVPDPRIEKSVAK